MKRRDWIWNVLPLESDEKKGSHFYISLPLPPQDQPGPFDLSACLALRIHPSVDHTEEQMAQGAVHRTGGGE